MPLLCPLPPLLLSYIKTSIRTDIIYFARFEKTAYSIRRTNFIPNTNKRIVSFRLFRFIAAGERRKALRVSRKTRDILRDRKRRTHYISSNRKSVKISFLHNILEIAYRLWYNWIIMIGVYFSGTGNTEHCVTRFVNKIDKTAKILPLENGEVINHIQNEQEIIFGYPVYYSNLPKIVRDFIVNNRSLWKGKKIFIISTMGLFSGDGAGCSARLFKKYGATVLGGLHLKMPDCIGDVKLLKRSLEENKNIIEKAHRKIDESVDKYNAKTYPKEGLNFFYRFVGLFGQRLYFFRKTENYYTKIKTDSKKCIQCGLCVSLCPMKNIEMNDGKIIYNDKCTMCYRCFANCPKQAITVLGNKVYEQCKFDNYYST